MRIEDRSFEPNDGEAEMMSEMSRQMAEFAKISARALTVVSGNDNRARAIVSQFFVEMGAICGLAHARSNGTAMNREVWIEMCGYVFDKLIEGSSH